MALGQRLLNGVPAALGEGTNAHSSTAGPVALVVQQDVTERIELERRKDEFIGMAGHELKTPVSPSTQLWTEYAKLPAQLSNRRLETAATRLFGSDPRRQKFLRTVAHQQALLQIYEDFCMQDNSDCAQCPFPEQMADWL